MIVKAETDAPVDRPRQEIQKVLARYGADHFRYSADADRAVVLFRAHSRQIRFVLPLGLPPESKAKEKAEFVRTRWRCLLLSIEAKLATVESGISQFETEFLPYTVLPNGQTVADHLLPFVREAYEGRKMLPPLGFGRA